VDKVAVGATLIAVGIQIPDYLGSVSMAKANMHEGAISSTISSQVLIITLGFGIPWLLSIWVYEKQVDLKVDVSGDRMETVLISMTFFVAFTFMFATLAPGFAAEKSAGLSLPGAWLLMTVFILTFSAFIIIEFLYETGNLGALAG
jgi:Ca2+/Na+ antiporter